MRAVKRMIPVYLLALAVVTACAVLFSGSYTAMAQVLELQESSGLPTIVLDPGHGGEDGGAVSAYGTKESCLNLEIGLRARDLLRFLGLSVVMTRDSDISIYGPEAVTVSEKKVSDLKNRVRLTQQTDHALLLSIHQNMFSESKYRGAQLFYAGTEGSRALAERLQEIIGSKLDPANHRQAKECKTVYLLNKIHCTGVLVECGFLSNPEEERMLQSESYQKLLVTAICAGVYQYISELQIC